MLDLFSFMVLLTKCLKGLLLQLPAMAAVELSNLDVFFSTHPPPQKISPACKTTTLLSSIEVQKCQN